MKKISIRCCFLIFLFIHSTLVFAQAWAMPQFNFEILPPPESGLQPFSAQEVSGMEQEVQIIEYRQSNSALFSTEKMPGIARDVNITLARPVFVNDNNLWKFLALVRMQKVPTGTWIINLKNEEGESVISWKLLNAWPKNITGANLKSDGDEVAIDTLTLSHEGLVVTNIRQ